MLLPPGTTAMHAAASPSTHSGHFLAGVPYSTSRVPPLRICYVRSTAHNLLLWFQSPLGRYSVHIVWRPLLRIRKSHIMTTTKEVSLIYQTSRNDIIVTSEWNHFSLERTWVCGHLAMDILFLWFAKLSEIDCKLWFAFLAAWFEPLCL